VKKAILVLTSFVALLGGRAASAGDGLDDWLHLCDKRRAEYWTKLCTGDAGQDSAKMRGRSDESAQKPAQRWEPEREIVRQPPSPGATRSHEPD
jgi:hypothetical protein